MNRRQSVLLSLMLMLGLTVGAVASGGNGAGQADETADAAEQAPPPPPPTPTVEDAMRQLEDQRRQPPPVIDPQRRQVTEPAPVTRPAVDPNVVGLLPGKDPPPLRREGEFVLNRRGRLVRSADGHHAIFVFDSNSQNAVEPPMILMPCLLLQNMEDLVRDRGDDITFEISGQVFVYRGANYLLPTMMRHRPIPDQERR